MQGVSLIKQNRNNVLPNRLLYQFNRQKDEAIDSYEFGRTKQYRMLDVKSGKLLGEMDVKPCEPYMSCSFKLQSPSLYINYLRAFQKNSEVGSDFIKFAQKISKQAGCDGHVHLHATKLKNEQTYPNVFYRKQGFKTESKLTNLILDLCILLGIRETKSTRKIMRMYK